MDARTAVMIHGAGGGVWEWNVWRRVFEARGWVVRVPELVAGASGVAGTRLEDYVGQVEAAVAASSGASSDGAADVVLVGASLGGLLAAIVAARLARRSRREQRSYGGDASDGPVCDGQPRQAGDALIAAVRVGALVLVNPMPPAPWHAELPSREPHADLVPWGRDASLESTRRSLFDADDATCLYAYQRWRDESGAVMNAARAGVPVKRPACPVLVLGSERDDDLPLAASAALARAWQAAFVPIAAASHVGPLLGRGAARWAEVVESWLAAVM
jgi:pimeloyl-ACP methyl ester carboxylesterase